MIGAFGLVFTAVWFIYFPSELPRSDTVHATATAKCAIPKFEPAFERAAAVFVGKVLTKKSEGQTKVFELEVERFWKGVDAKTITIYVNENPRYQAQFEVGENYLVFAERSEGDERFFDRRCSRTKLMKAEYGDLKEDLKKLGEAKTCIDLEKNN